MRVSLQGGLEDATWSVSKVVSCPKSSILEILCEREKDDESKNIKIEEMTHEEDKWNGDHSSNEAYKLAQ